MQTVAQPQDFVTPPFQHRGASRRAIQNSMNDLSLRVLKRLDIPDRGARLVLSIQAAIGHSSPGEVCQRSRYAIAQGLKLKGDRDQQKDRVSKLIGMLKTQQAKAGRLLIECIPGNLTEAPKFLDYLGPLVEAADNGRRQNPKWKGGKEDKRELTDQAVDWILENLPTAEPEEEREPGHLPPNEYIRRRSEDIKRAADRAADRIETECSTIVAVNFMKQLSRDLWRMADSLEKTAIARLHSEKESTGPSGLRELTNSESEAEEEGGGIPQKGDPPADNSTACNANLSESADYEAEPDNNFWEPPTDLERLDAALHYARLGRRIVPVYGLTPEGHCQCKKGAECQRSPGKHPRIDNWQNEATTDESQIRKWWRKWPSSNLGWAMGGAAGFLALDFDGEPGEAIYQELKTKGFIPPTVEQKTGSGGRQAIFRDAPNLKNEVKVVPGLDLRSQGGQVVVPPSISGKGPYFWRTDLSEPAVLPRDLFEWIQGKLLDQEEARLEETTQRQGRTFASSGASLPSVILEGTRNRDLFGYGCGLRNSGANREQILDALIDKNHLCSPPLPLDEIRDIAASCCRYQPAPV